MNTESALEQSEVREQPVSLPFPSAMGWRILYLLFVIVMPIFSFWATDLNKPEWQDGKLGSYIILLLFPKASLFFFALLAFSIVCYWLLLFDIPRYSGIFFVQLGIYTGAVLALQYSLILLLHSLDSYVFVLLPLWLAPFIIPWFYRWAVAKWTATKVNIFLAILTAVLVIIGSATGSIVFIVIFLLVVAAPFWSFLIAIRAAIWLFKNNVSQFTIYRGLGITAWIATYAFAWRYDILKMFELYATLPKQPPQDCYIATAAAQGHPRIVGSQMVHRADGKSMRVNGQLQRLKCVELALMVVNPSLHKVFRKIYDVVGKALAQRMTNPFVADVAYLLLKPAELFAIFILKKIVPEIESVSRRMYSESDVS